MSDVAKESKTIVRTKVSKVSRAKVDFDFCYWLDADDQLTYS